MEWWKRPATAGWTFRLSDTLYEFKNSIKNKLDEIWHFATLGQNAILTIYYINGFRVCYEMP